MPEPLHSAGASADPDPRPIEPVEPDFEACCGNGCEPCIFDLYAIERERYLADLRAWEKRRSGAASA